MRRATIPAAQRRVRYVPAAMKLAPRRTLARRLSSRMARPGEARVARPDELWRNAIEESLVTPLNLHFLHELVQRVGRLGVEGDIVECGVYRGGSAAILGWSMMGLGDDARKLWLFDSFAGMPAATDRDGEFSHTLEGQYVGSEATARRLVQQAGVPPERCEIVVGPFEQTYRSTPTPRAALLHVDCDFYEPVRQTLEKFFPSMPAGGFVVLNDYGIYKGARAATDEFLERHSLAVEPVAIDPTAAFFQKPGDGFSGLPVAGHFPGFPGAVA
jgi:O-methyltransferase